MQSEGHGIADTVCSSVLKNVFLLVPHRHSCPSLLDSVLGSEQEQVALAVTGEQRQVGMEDEEVDG